MLILNIKSNFLNIFSGYDYFQGSEVPYIFGCIIVIFIPLALGCSAYGVVKIMNSRRRKIKTKWEENNNGKAMDKMYVKVQGVKQRFFNRKVDRKPRNIRKEHLCFCLTAATAHTFLINEIAQEHNLSAVLTNFPC